MTDMKIAIQGGPASFYHIAAGHHFGEGHEYVYCTKFSEVFKTLQAGQADVGLAAMENSMYGSVSKNYDLLLQYRFPIVAEIVEYIHQNLIALTGTKLSDIKTVYSQAEALAQCMGWLGKNLPEAETIAFYDTAGSVKHVKELGDKSAAAIASAPAAEHYGLEIISSEIQDTALNFTRFLVLEPGGKTPKDSNKASMVITTTHELGALNTALGVIASAGGNLTKLESRPIPGKVWKYQFFADIEISPEELDGIVKKLEDQDCTVVVLGIYQAAGTTFED